MIELSRFFHPQLVATSSNLKDITDTVYQKSEELCQCGFTVQQITDARFKCFSNFDQVTYRGRLHGTALATSLQLIGYIEHWVAEDVIISVQNITLWVDSSCPVSISSFEDPECPSPDDTMSSHREHFSPAIIGGIAAAAVLAVVISTVITLVLVKKYRARTTQEHTR